MKSFNTVMALLIGAALLTAGAGCKHTPKAPTLIPSSGPRTVENGGTPANPVLPRTGSGPGGVTPGGINSNDQNIGGNKLPGTGDNGANPVAPRDLESAGRPGERPNMGDVTEDAAALQAETLYFDLDRSSVKGSEMPKLERVAAFLKSEATAKLRVEGNCDERGTEEYNRSLGERRALAAREVLVNLGVAPDRITTTTYGEDKPADAGHDEGAWAKNRRDDFVVLRPKTGTGLQ